MNKICTQCKIDKNLEEYYSNTDRNGNKRLRSDCKSCFNKKPKNKEKNKIRAKQYYCNNKDIISKKAKEYRNKEDVQLRIKERQIRYYDKAKEYKKENKDKISKYAKNYAIEHKERLKTKRQNRSHIENSKNREKYKKNLNYRLSVILRSRLYIAINKNQKIGSAIDDLGCTIPELKQYLESKFEPGMTWENWGNKNGCWSIDHIIPLSKVDLQNIEQFQIVNHYTNLQPLWHIDNIKKGNRYE